MIFLLELKVYCKKQFFHELGFSKKTKLRLIARCASLAFKSKKHRKSEKHSFSFRVLIEIGLYRIVCLLFSYISLKREERLYRKSVSIKMCIASSFQPPSPQYDWIYLPVDPLSKSFCILFAKRRQNRKLLFDRRSPDKLFSGNWGEGGFGCVFIAAVAAFHEMFSGRGGNNIPHRRRFGQASLSKYA